MPRTGVEPARLAALAPETSASTIPPPGLLLCKGRDFFLFLQVVGRFFFVFAVGIYRSLQVSTVESKGFFGGDSLGGILRGDLPGGEGQKAFCSPWMALITVRKMILMSSMVDQCSMYQTSCSTRRSIIQSSSVWPR